MVDITAEHSDLSLREAAEYARFHMVKLTASGEDVEQLFLEIDRLRTRLAQAKRERDEARGLLREAKCPNTPQCDNQGTIYLGCELEPCQWCRNRDAHLRGEGD